MPFLSLSHQGWLSAEGAFLYPLASERRQSGLVFPVNACSYPQCSLPLSTYPTKTLGCCWSLTIQYGFLIKHSSDRHMCKKFKFRLPTRARNTITRWKRAFASTVGQQFVNGFFKHRKWHLVCQKSISFSRWDC